MVKCICIDDKNKPKVIPIEKWVKQGSPYHITHVGRTMGTNIVTVTLQEINLTAECYPYQGFRIERFGFDPNDIQKLLDLMEECSKLSGIDIGEVVTPNINPEKVEERELAEILK